MSQPILIDDLIDRYEVLLIDAYGVLNDASGALPGACELIAELERRDKRFLVVTNDASRLPQTVAQRLRSFGLAVDTAHVVTSGMLLAPYFGEHGLRGGRCMVLGPQDSQRYVLDAGGRVVGVDAEGQLAAVVVADDEGYPFLQGVEAALNAIGRHLERGWPIQLVLPNPDVIYPQGGGNYGLTSGAVALLIEAGLQRRFGDDAPRFARLGKPHSPLFEEARRRAGTDQLVMLGDQLETDIRGALRCGIDAALLATGISRWDEQRGAPDDRPTFLIEELAPRRTGAQVPHCRNGRPAPSR